MNSKLDYRDSLAIDCMKAFAILSVIAAHTVLLDTSNVLSHLITSLWNLFGKVGVIVFFIVGGFLYSRKDGDNRVFWKKKFFRIVLPWLLCSAITYLVGLIGGNNFSIYGYIKWILGYGTWYYYIILYLLFLAIFKLFYKRKVVLVVLMVVQLITLTINTLQLPIGIDKIPYEWYYLNPLFWVGYFSLGILIRHYRLDIRLRDSKLVLIFAITVMVSATAIMHIKGIYTYFSLVAMINCLATAVILWNLSYLIANSRLLSLAKEIGVSTYCIYLLHMQIVQTAIGLLPASDVIYILAPFIGLAIMMAIIYIANWVCDKLPFGQRLKMCFGL